MRIELHPDADAEFARAIIDFNKISPGLGNRFYREVMQRLDWIAQNPQVVRERGGYRRINLRVFPHYIAYVFEGEPIWVLAICHGHRKPLYWKDRLRD